MESLVSVIVPIYNGEKYIRKTVESILNQTYTKLDIILIDDGSTDSSFHICGEYQDERLRIYRQDNKGLSAARQFGIEKAKGEFFCTVDADDYIDKHFVEILLNKSISFRTDICVCGRYDFADTCGGGTSYEEIPMEPMKDSLIITKKQLALEYNEISRRLVLSDSWNKMYRTEFVRRSGVVFALPKSFIGNDFAFNHKLIMHCPVVYTVDRSLLYHRIADNSMVHKRKNNMQEGFEVIVLQLKEEAERCKLDIDENIANIYFSLLTQVFWNVVIYGRELCDDIEKYVQMNKDFMKNHSWLYTSGICKTDRFLDDLIIKNTREYRKFILIFYAYLFKIIRKIKKLVC